MNWFHTSIKNSIKNDTWFDIVFVHVIHWHSSMYLHVCIWSESWRGSEELIQSRLWVCVKAVHPRQWQRSDWLPALLTARPSIRATNHRRRPSGQQLAGLWWPVSHDSLRSFTCSLSPHWEMMGFISSSWERQLSRLMPQLSLLEDFPLGSDEESSL